MLNSGVKAALTALLVTHQSHALDLLDANPEPTVVASSGSVVAPPGIVVGGDLPPRQHLIEHATAPLSPGASPEEAVHESRAVELDYLFAAHPHCEADVRYVLATVPLALRSDTYITLLAEGCAAKNGLWESEMNRAKHAPADHEWTEEEVAEGLAEMQAAMAEALGLDAGTDVETMAEALA